MQDIHRIYYNEFGIAFQWKRDIAQGNTDIIQLVFRRTGFYLTLEEIKEFANNIQDAKAFQPCDGCKASGHCETILLQTPLRKVDLAVTRKELTFIEDLVKGTLFKIELEGYLSDLSLN